MRFILALLLTCLAFTADSLGQPIEPSVQQEIKEYMMRAMHHGRHSEWKQACWNLDRILELEPTESGYLVRALCRFMNGDIAGATQDLDDSQSAIATLHPKGLAFAKRAVAGNAQSADTHALRGMVYFWFRQSDAAVRELTQSINSNPKEASLIALRGHARLMQRETDKALDDFDEAIRLDPAELDTYYLRGMALLRQGEVVAAFEDFGMSANRR